MTSLGQWAKIVTQSLVVFRLEYESVEAQINFLAFLVPKLESEDPWQIRIKLAEQYSPWATQVAREEVCGHKSSSSDCAGVSMKTSSDASKISAFFKKRVICFLKVFTSPNKVTLTTTWRHNAKLFLTCKFICFFFTGKCTIIRIW